MSLCKKPFHGHGCGQCLPCRITRRRLWTHRILLEASKHGDNSFVTLTYDPENEPPGRSLDPRHPQLWLKKLRKALGSFKLRYYLVGEYGDESSRPHYHAALFGVPTGLEDIVRSTWGKGHILLGDLSLHSAQYIAGYVTKKMTSWDDPRLLGRHPEFARMSLRPGIGATAISDISESILSNDAGLRLLASLNDVPSSLSHGSKSFPLGRYLKGKLRYEMGFTRDLSDYEIQRWKESLDRERVHTESAKVSLLYNDYIDSTRSAEKSWLTYMEEMKQQKILNLESRFKLYSSQRSL